MTDKRVDYDQIAHSFGDRYVHGSGMPGVEAALRDLASAGEAHRALEVGCGTAHWIGLLQPMARLAVGLDLHTEMLRQGRKRPEPLHLVRGRAEGLPFAAGAFGLVFCVNALHHFDDPRRFIAQARRLLGPGGTLALVGMDPSDASLRWFAYDYFEGLRETDLDRFPHAKEVRGWMEEAGFTSVERRPVHRIEQRRMGREILEDYFLGKETSSQFMLLSDEAYAAGLERIRSALDEAETAGESLEFVTDIPQFLTSGRVPPGPS